MTASTDNLLQKVCSCLQDEVRPCLDSLTLAEYSIDESNEAFTIDDLGNRDSVIIRDGNNVDYAIDNLTNRYDSVDGNTLAYDAAGNLTTDKDGYQYEYDYENRITKIIKSGPTTVAEFAYDALGRRIKKRDSIANTNNIYYYNDNWQILCDYNDAGTPQSWFAYGNYIDEAVLMSKSFTSWLSARYYIHDHLYSPAALMGSTGAAPIERYEYDAYGNCQIMDASYNPRSSSSYGNPYYFTGRQLDFLDGGNLKIQYNRNRYYDYYTGRWLTPDPEEYADGLNLYEYGGSDPVSRTDPFGDIVSLEECESTVAAISDDPSLKELYDKARTKKNFFGACLKKMKCKKCCRAPLMGIYDPFKRQVTLCAQNNPNADELKRTIRHELIHAISMCGDAMPKSCKACMEEEIRAYYWAGDCDTRERCAKRAWGSCRGGPLSPCGLAKKDGYKKYIPSEDKWPPSKVDGLPGDGPRDKSEVVKWPTCSMD